MEGLPDNILDLCRMGNQSSGSRASSVFSASSQLGLLLISNSMMDQLSNHGHGPNTSPQRRTYEQVAGKIGIISETELETQI
jgi:hypothetical protein